MWTENDLTGTHASLITLISGADAWEQLDPFRGPMTLIQLLAVFIAIDERRTPTDVVGELGVLPIKRLLAAVSLAE